MRSMLPWFSVSSRSRRAENLRRVVCKVEEKGDSFHAAVFLEVSCEESTRLEIDTHGTENDREIFLMPVVNVFGGFANETCLTTDLRCNLVVW